MSVFVPAYRNCQKRWEVSLHTTFVAQTRPFFAIGRRTPAAPMALLPAGQPFWNALDVSLDPALDNEGRRPLS
ncbi:MAG: hypothetical protein E6R14_05050 [Thermomicrobiales bacterium]|nr:MAG: hypothetical protein E6R14_05050 [Thermomicrobiales bacterium]